MVQIYSIYSIIVQIYGILLLQVNIITQQIQDINNSKVQNISRVQTNYMVQNNSRVQTNKDTKYFNVIE